MICCDSYHPGPPVPATHVDATCDECYRPSYNGLLGGEQMIRDTVISKATEDGLPIDEGRLNALADEVSEEICYLTDQAVKEYAAGLAQTRMR